MKWLIILLIILSSCATKQERARRLIIKANSLYPITTMIDTVIVIDTLIKWDTTIVVKIDSISFTIRIDVPINGKFSPYREKEVFRSNEAVVKASLREDGTMNFRVDVKPKTVYLEGQVKYKDKIEVKKELIVSPPKIVLVKNWIYKLGWLTLLAAIGFSFYKGYKYYKGIMP